MASLDLSDPHISTVHDALLRNSPTRWLLLEYGHGPQALVLSASGTGDVDDMRAHLKENVTCYGIFREQTQNKFLRISINFIPNSVKGVWRARALVHVTAVASKFKVHEVLTISNSEQLSVQLLRSTLRLPPRALQVSSSAPLSDLLGSDERPNNNSVPGKPPPDLRSVSMPASPPRTRSPSPTNKPYFHPPSPSLAPSLHTEEQIPLTATDIPSLATGNGPFAPITPVARKSSLPTKISPAGFSGVSSHSSQLQSPLVTSPESIQFINDTRVLHTPLSASWLAKQYSPLPPSPPSKLEDHFQDAEGSSVESDAEPLPVQIGSIPDSNSVASLHIPDSEPDSAPVPSSSIILQPVNSAVSAQHIAEISSRPIDGLPPASLSSPPTPQPTASQPVTSGGVNDHNITNRAPADDPIRLSVSKRPLSRFQERASSPADAEEERKLVVLEEERRRRAVERARREKEIREEEEAREREFEERKEREKKKRLENARKLEEQRIEQKRRQEEEEARKKAEKEKKEAEVQERRSRIKQRFEKKAGMDLLTGFITLESSSSWKRRYYRLSTEDWVFFKNDEDTTMPIHAIELSRIRALREWHEGYEELEAIPNSFAIEFKNDAPCLFFADSAEDKEILLGLLNQAAGL